MKLLGALALLLVAIYVLKPLLDQTAKDSHDQDAPAEIATEPTDDEMTQLRDQLAKAYAGQPFTAEVMHYLESEDGESWLAVVDLVAENGVQNSVEIIFQRDTFGRKVGEFEGRRFVIYPNSLSP